MPTELSFSPNRLYYGDCLDVMRGWQAECVDLIYLDPPFNSKANYNILYGGGNGVPAQEHSPIRGTGTRPPPPV